MSDRPRRILAVDYGDARTGLAATDWTGSITVPLPRIDERDPKALIAAIVAVVRPPGIALRSVLNLEHFHLRWNHSRSV